MARNLKETLLSPGEVILEATRGNKEFQLLKVKTTKVWKTSWRNLGTARGRKATYNTESISYEFKWRNVGSEQWGRTPLATENGKTPSHTGAFKIFFQALDYSESMSFRELDYYGEYKYPDTNK